MAFKPVYPVAADRVVFLPANASAFTYGDLVVRDTTAGRVQPAVATRADATEVEGIAKKTVTPAAGDYIEVILVHDGMLLEADCTANSATNQLCKAHLLTDAANVNNTSTHSTDKDAVFIAFTMSGSTGDKKLIGRVAKIGQVLS